MRKTRAAAADRSMPSSWPLRSPFPGGPSGLRGIAKAGDISCEFAFRSFAAKNSVEGKNHSHSMRRDARRVAPPFRSNGCGVSWDFTLLFLPYRCGFRRWVDRCWLSLVIYWNNYSLWYKRITRSSRLLPIHLLPSFSSFGSLYTKIIEKLYTLSLCYLALLYRWF